jgi:hypothetical protein
VPIVFKSMLVACTLPSLVAIFMSGNRSGYLGAAFVGLMLFRDRRIKGLIFVAAIAGAVVFWLTQWGTTEVFDEKVQQTMQGYGTQTRVDITLACWEIGLENLLTGVSPQQLPFEIGRRAGVRGHEQFLDSHNVFGHVFAATGGVTFLALMAVGWTMCAWRARNGVKIGGDDDPLRNGRRLIRMMVALWVLRGIFTREILYNPSFNIALGLCIGLCLLAEVERESAGLAGPKPRTTPPGPNRPLPSRVPRPAR